MSTAIALSDPDTNATLTIASKAYAETVEQAAALGVLIAPGEPFFLRIGHNDVVRFNAGSAQGVDHAFEIGQVLSQAIVRAAENSSGSFLLPHV